MAGSSCRSRRLAMRRGDLVTIRPGTAVLLPVTSTSPATLTTTLVFALPEVIEPVQSLKNRAGLSPDWTYAAVARGPQKGLIVR